MGSNIYENLEVTKGNTLKGAQGVTVLIASLGMNKDSFYLPSMHGEYPMVVFPHAFQTFQDSYKWN